MQYLMFTMPLTRYCRPQHLSRQKVPMWVTSWASVLGLVVSLQVTDIRQAAVVSIISPPRPCQTNDDYLELRRRRCVAPAHLFQRQLVYKCSAAPVVRHLI